MKSVVSARFCFEGMSLVYQWQCHYFSVPNGLIIYATPFYWRKIKILVDMCSIDLQFSIYRSSIICFCYLSRADVAFNDLRSGNIVAYTSNRAISILNLYFFHFLFLKHMEGQCNVWTHIIITYKSWYFFHHLCPMNL